MKVALIAQVVNWRGGIQQYSQNYARALDQQVDLIVIGYKSYFPLWLYPGDKKKITRQHRPWDSHIPLYNILKYFSPLASYRAFRIISKKEQADVADIQWCTTFHAPILITLVLLLRFFSRVKVFITVHNVLPHESRFFDKFFCNILYKSAHRLVVHSQKMQDDLVGIFHIDPAQTVIIPHGICMDYKERIDAQVARDHLGIKQKFVLLFFGLVRPYKGLDILLRGFATIAEEFDVALIVAGDFVEDRAPYDQLIRDNHLEDKTFIFPGYVDDKDVPLYFSAADVVIQPYQHFAGQSGVPPTAYFYEKPVIASRVGGLPEIVLDQQTGLVIDPDASQLAKAIRTLLTHPERMRQYGRNGKAVLEHDLSWENIAQIMQQEYRQAVNTTASP